MKFKVREDLEVGKFYGGIHFTKGMNRFKGRIIEINSENPNRYLYGNCIFSKEMLEPVEDEEMKVTKSIILTSPRTMISDALEGKGLFYTVDKKQQFDEVNKPQHYADRKYEVIDVIEDSVSQTEFKGFLRGNVIKYIMRYDKKGGVQDLEKSNWYLQKLIEVEKEGKCEQ